MYRVGDILKLSQGGLEWLAKDNEGKRAKLAILRFEYRCPSRKTLECITVKRLGKNTYEQYHRRFLEVA